MKSRYLILSAIIAVCIGFMSYLVQNKNNPIVSQTPTARIVYDSNDDDYDIYVDTGNGDEVVSHAS